MNLMLDHFTRRVFALRNFILLLFTVATLVLGWKASGIRVDASFEKGLPSKHPYIETFKHFQGEVGGANRILIALHAKTGSIFTPEFFDQLRRSTDEVFFIQGVDRGLVQSLTTPNVRYVEVIEDGFAGGPVIPADFTPDEAGFAVVRDNILKSGKLGQLVANDFSAAMISAQFLERDPKTGQRIDYTHIGQALEALRTRVEKESDISVHIIGFAKAMHDIGNGAREVVLFFGISILITSLLIWNYAGRWKLAAAPVLCSLVAVIWQLGVLASLGYGIDPLSILVPFLVFAIGVSHGVQMVRAFRTEVFNGADGLRASHLAFRQLLVTGGLALVTDTFGFLTILLIDIPTIRELALTASIGVGLIILTNLFLLPILLSYLVLPRGYADWVARRRQRTDCLWARVAAEMKPVPSLVIILLSLGLGFWGWQQAGKVQIGDLQAGLPELHQNSRYNQDTAFITSKFSIGVDILTVIFAGEPNACVDHEVMQLMDRFEGAMLHVPGVRSVLGASTVAKIVNAGWNEGSLKWRILPDSPEALAQALAPVDTATGLINADGSVLPVMLFLKDHKAATLRSVTDAVKVFAETHKTEKVQIRLASGNAGVMAATNEIVEASQTPILLWIFGTVIALCLINFRSIRAVFCIILPLAIVSYLSYALMVALDIGLKTSTLPVVALGVGIGVDYGIYIFARLQNALRSGEYFEDAMFMAFKDTGSAVIFTGVTLALGVSTWLLSDLKFQADMGLLLIFMFLVNMLAAILLLPALARWLWRHHSAKGDRD